MKIMYIIQIIIFLTIILYKFELEKKHIRALSEYHNYVNYDNIKRVVNIRSNSLKKIY